jgi:hypothetical protein
MTESGGRNHSIARMKLVSSGFLANPWFHLTADVRTRCSA